MQSAEIINRIEEPTYFEASNAFNVSRSRISYCDKLVTPCEAARVIGVSLITRVQWCYRGRPLPFLEWPGKHGKVRYYESNLAAVCDQRGNAPTLH